MDINLTATPEVIVQQAEIIAVQLTRDKLKTNQIRNFYSAITRMRTNYEQAEDGNEGYDQVRRDLVMLKPKLAYAAGRQTAVRTNFYPYMKAAIESVEQAPNHQKTEAMDNFFLLVESIVAYHKYHGGE